MFQRSGGRKVFCIGFNKTGTTSLHEFFLAARLPSLHNIEWPHWTYDATLKARFRRWTCYSDGQQSNFRNLDEWFPESLFVLNTRAVRPWIRSRIKHVMRLGYSPDFERGIFPDQLGPMGMEFFTAPEAAIDKWLLERALYHQAVRRHFPNRANFIQLDVTADENWATVLSGFLESRGYGLVEAAQAKAIHANSRDAEVVTDQAMMERFFLLADARIEALSVVHPLD